MKFSVKRTLFLIWLAWAIIMTAYQMIVPQRLVLRRPDYALSWTPNETNSNSQNNKPYILDPFLNEKVSWDSEFYISIATAGYDDPTLRGVVGPDGSKITLNYAFFPFYPVLISVLNVPMGLFGLNVIATSTLSGLLIALLGTLAAMVALFGLAEPTLGEDGAFRAVFYMLIFPSSMFFAQVYTEGLFIGLAFSSLYLLKQKKWLLAGILAALATWTRAAGMALFIPILWQAVSEGGWRTWNWQKAKFALSAALPIAAFAGWYFSPLGVNFRIVEEKFFGRQALSITKTIGDWTDRLSKLADNSQGTVYYALEIALITIAVIACIAALRKYPALALFSLAVVVLSLFSGSAQSVGRYVAVIPVLYISLAEWGKSRAFDRAWTLTSILLLGMEALLFSFDLWVN